MFKRIFWLVIGAGFGFGLSFWLMRVVRSTVERYRPDNVSSDIAGALGQLGRDIKSAAAEGRLAMKEREEQLRAELPYHG